MVMIGENLSNIFMNLKVLTTDRLMTPIIIILEPIWKGLKKICIKDIAILPKM